ncbi:hypothetical protein NQZ68_026446 [Dissostichus eleginoides]|nr:hypothetical protein NQZ68_026446 [Dissostichus eleginoides]
MQLQLRYSRLWKEGLVVLGWTSRLSERERGAVALLTAVQLVGYGRQLLALSLEGCWIGVQLLYELLFSWSSTWARLQKHGILRQASSVLDPPTAAPASPVRSSAGTALPDTSTCSPSADFGSPTEGDSVPAGDDGPFADTVTLEQKTSSIGGTSGKVSLWMQWMLPKVTAKLFAPDPTDKQKEICVISELEDLSASVDVQDVYTKVKCKVGSFNIDHHRCSQAVKGTWPFFGPVLDSTPSLVINALTTDVIIDMDCDLPENKHLSRVLVVQQTAARALSPSLNLSTLCALSFACLLAQVVTALQMCHKTNQSENSRRRINLSQDRVTGLTVLERKGVVPGQGLHSGSYEGLILQCKETAVVRSLSEPLHTEPLLRSIRTPHFYSGWTDRTTSPNQKQHRVREEGVQSSCGSGGVLLSCTDKLNRRTVLVRPVSKQESFSHFSGFFPPTAAKVLEVSHQQHGFLSITYTQAVTKNVRHKLTTRPERPPRSGATTSSQRLTSDPLADSSPQYLREILLTAQPFDVVLSCPLLATVAGVFQATVPRRYRERGKTAGQPMRIHTLTSRSLPLMYINTSVIRVFCPSAREKHTASDPQMKKEDTLVLKLGSVSMAPQADNPLTRTVLRKDIYQ